MSDDIRNMFDKESGDPTVSTLLSLIRDNCNQFQICEIAGKLIAPFGGKIVKNKPSQDVQQTIVPSVYDISGDVFTVPENGTYIIDGDKMILLKGELVKISPDVPNKEGE